MKINLLQLEEGAGYARGIAVIIDVFRAFSLEAVLFANGASEIICCKEEERACQLRAEHPDWILIGERDGKILPGFDYGNSPAAIKDLSFAGRTVIHTTTNGTRGLAAAVHADKLLVGSFLNRRAEAAGGFARMYGLEGADNRRGYALRRLFTGFAEGRTL